MKLKCLIIDDEPNAVNLLEALVEQITEWEVAGKCYNGLEALNFMKAEPVDFIFLDINMPQLSGIELAGLLPETTKIIFTTAYAEHAATSYNFQTIDYLLKPVTLQRFLASVHKIERAFDFKIKLKEPSAMAEPQHFFMKSGKILSKIILDDILYFEGEKEYVRLVACSQELLLYRRLKDMEEQLPAHFVRVHNSFIVNIKQLIKVQDNHVFIGTKRIPISNKFRNSFMHRIRQRIF